MTLMRARLEAGLMSLGLRLLTAFMYRYRVVIDHPDVPAAVLILAVNKEILNATIAIVPTSKQTIRYTKGH